MNPCLGVYQASSEPSLSVQIEDPSGKFFQDGLAACAAGGLAYRQKEVYLNRVFVRDTAKEQEGGEDKAWKEAKASETEAVPYVSMSFEGTPQEILATLQEHYKNEGALPDMTITEVDGGVDVKVMMFGWDPNGTDEDVQAQFSAEQAMFAALYEKHAEISHEAGWMVSKSTGSGENLQDAKEKHEQSMRGLSSDAQKPYYSEKEITQATVAGGWQ